MDRGAAGKPSSGCEGMISAAFSPARWGTKDRQIATGKAGLKSVSSGNFPQAAPCRKTGRSPSMSSPKIRDCSGRAADAVRSHSSLTVPATEKSCAAAVPGIASPPRSRIDHLTPARLVARSWFSQSRHRNGFGVAVLAGTALEPLQNRQSLEITGNSSRFSRFSVLASRDARAYVCVRLRACREPSKHRTTEPQVIIVIYHVVSGSVVVLKRFCPEPAVPNRAGNGRVLRFRHILAGGNAAISVDGWPDRACSTPLAGRGAKSFGVFRAGSVTWSDPASMSPAPSWSIAARVVLRVSNGGILRFPTVLIGHVGRVMLEGWPQRRGNAWFLDGQPLPVRQRRSTAAGAEARAWCATRGGIAAARGTPVPPFAARVSPSTLTHERGQIWIDYSGSSSGRGRNRQSWGLRSGSGWGFRSPLHRTGRAGQGRGAGGSSRRSGQARAGAVHVN